MVVITKSIEFEEISIGEAAEIHYPFWGDFKDWLRFWNQFSVEIYN